jgi:hypothetical protein
MLGPRVPNHRSCHLTDIADIDTIITAAAATTTTKIRIKNAMMQKVEESGQLRSVMSSESDHVAPGNNSGKAFQDAAGNSGSLGSARNVRPGEEVLLGLV